MTELATALQQVLRQVRRETEHAQSCGVLDPNIVNPHDTDIEPACTCDWQERVEAEQARRWAASFDAAISKTDSFCPWWATHGGLTPEQSAKCLAEVHAVTLRAAQQEAK